MQEDGACLFRAIADQVFGDQDMHDQVRENCMDYLVGALVSFSLLFWVHFFFLTKKDFFFFG